MIDWLVLSGALLSGLLGSVHCAAMCGGIATGASIGFSRQHALAAALQLNLGRIGGYALAGALVGGFGSALVGLARLDALQIGMRMAVGAVLLLAALRVLFPGRLDMLGPTASLLWNRLRPLHRRLLPANSVGKRLLLGALWGWLPCGLSATLLTAAWLSTDALQGGLLMASFGIGTWVTMLPLSWSGASAGRWLQTPRWRRLGGSVLLLSGLLTVLAPWLAQHPALHAVLAALGCRTLV